MIDIYPKGKDEFCGTHALYQINVPDWFGRNELFLTLKKHTKYNVSVRYPSWENTSEYAMALTMESLIEQVKNTKLYKKVEIPHYKKTEIIDEIRDFEMSPCFTIANRVFNHAYGYVNGMTFFSVEKEIPAEDIAFVDDELKKNLQCQKAKSGNYFLYGEWKFYRSKSNPSRWKAEKVHYKKELEKIEIRTVEI